MIKNTFLFLRFSLLQRTSGSWICSCQRKGFVEAETLGTNVSFLYVEKEIKKRKKRTLYFKHKAFVTIWVSVFGSGVSRNHMCTAVYVKKTNIVKYGINWYDL